MNDITFALYKKLDGDLELRPLLMDRILKNISVYNDELKLKPFLNDLQFIILFNSIYSVLGHKINAADYVDICDNFIKLLIADQLDGEHIDIKWIINHIYYLCLGNVDQKIVSKYRDDIIFVQEKLIDEYDIRENFGEKVGRKIYTKYMSKVGE